MILYFDTSALIKLYVQEEFHEMVIKATEEANVIATHMIAFIEVYACFARLQRENKLNSTQLERIKKIFQKDWDNFLRLETVQPIMRQAANFAEVFALRAYDSVHLAAAHFLLKESSYPVKFACFDKKLNQAADVLGLLLLTTKELDSL